MLYVYLGYGLLENALADDGGVSVFGENDEKFAGMDFDVALGRFVVEGEVGVGVERCARDTEVGQRLPADGLRAVEGNVYIDVGTVYLDGLFSRGRSSGSARLMKTRLPSSSVRPMGRAFRSWLLM